MNRILIIQTAFLGDLILTTSFIREVKNVYPDSFIVVLVNKGTEMILNCNPHIDEIISLDKKKIKSSIIDFVKFIGKIRKKRFNICFCCHFSYRSSLISFFSGAKKRIGYSNSGFSFLHNISVFRPKLNKHETNKLYSLLFDTVTEYPKKNRPELFYTETQIKNIKIILKKNKIVDKKYIILAPSSVWYTKQMPKEKFQKLGEMIHSRLNYDFITIGSKKDEELGEFVCNRMGKNFCGQTNLIELSYLVQNSSCLVSNDSSPVHFASAHNIPTVSIFGATIPNFGYTSLSDKSFTAEVGNLSCRPCGIHGGNNCPKKHFRCMKEQNLETIFFYIEKFIT